MRETQVEQQTIRFAQKNGWFFRKVKWVGRRGAPDRMFAKAGMVIFVEFKKPNAKPRLQQQREIDRMRAAGLCVIVIDNVKTAHEIFL